MTWMIYSLNNGNCWNGSFELYLQIEDILSTLNNGLRHIDGFDGEFFDYFKVNEQYSEEVLRTISDALASRTVNEEIGYHLATLYEVYRGGNVIMG